MGGGGGIFQAEIASYKYDDTVLIISPVMRHVIVYRKPLICAVGLHITTGFNENEGLINADLIRNPIPAILITVQRDATQSSLFIILQVHCTCFGCQPHPSSVVHKTVTTASGTVQLPPNVAGVNQTHHEYT